MPYIVNEFSGNFIGIVKSYNKDTRELDVFVPKLMPGIKEDSNEVSLMTNLGQLVSNFPIKYNPHVKIASTIRARAKDTEDALPTVGSRVLVKFLDNNPMWPYWEKWNINNDFEVIDEEKYPYYFSLTLNGKSIDVDNSDKIEIRLPEGYEVVTLPGDDSKHKIFKVNLKNDIIERLNKLEETVGHKHYINKYKDPTGNDRVEDVDASGIFKEFDSYKQSITVSNLPTASKKYHGITAIKQSDDVADEVYICVCTSKSSNTYEWKQIV